MPGQGRPGDPLWFAIGFLAASIPGIYFHQTLAGVTIGIVLGGAFGLIREDKRRGHRRPTDPAWFVIGLVIGLAVGIFLHFLGLTWAFSIFIGLALGVVFGAVAGTIRADRCREQERENSDLARRYRD